jgi:hypothetical protein
VRRLLVTANIVPSSPILFTPMKEAVSSSETSVRTRATRGIIPEEAILHRIIKSKKLKWAGHAARTGGIGMCMWYW